MKSMLILRACPWSIRETMPLSSVEIRRNIPTRKLPRVISTSTSRVLYVDVCKIFRKANICHAGVYF